MSYGSGDDDGGKYVEPSWISCKNCDAWSARLKDLLEKMEALKTENQRLKRAEAAVLAYDACDCDEPCPKCMAGLAVVCVEARAKP